MSIDPRLMERRQTVAEDNAKRNVTRLLKFLAFALVVGALVWLVFSPWMSVSQVDTSGVEASNAYAILADQQVVAGTPMIRLDARGTEQALLEDPWVGEAKVRLHWPNRVEVAIVERVPVAWALTAGGWTRRAIDGVALPSGPEPDPEMVRIEMPELADVAATSTPEMLGALQFVEALPTSLRRGSEVSHHDGEMWATVLGYQVRLGRAVEMREKALSLSALLEEDLPAGAVLVLIAPTNPAVMSPGADDVTADDASAAADGTGGASDGAQPDPGTDD
jgi:POTRA domain, FtsQ-type